jgi:hypothetical protein
MLRDEAETFSQTAMAPADIAFSKRVLSRAGKLLQFFFYCLIQPEVSLRMG